MAASCWARPSVLMKPAHWCRACGCENTVFTSPSAAQFASMAPLLLMAVMPPTQVRPLLEMAETVTSVQLFVMTPFMACAPRMPPV